MATSASDQEQLLKLLAERGSLDSYDLSQELSKDHQVIVGTIKSLHSLGEVSKPCHKSTVCRFNMPQIHPTCEITPLFPMKKKLFTYMYRIIKTFTFYTGY